MTTNLPPIAIRENVPIARPDDSVAPVREPHPVALRCAEDYVPACLAAITWAPSSGLRNLVERFTADRHSLLQFYSVPRSSLQTLRMREFYGAWQTRLGEMSYASFGVSERIDLTLLRRRIESELKRLEREARQLEEVSVLLPFADAIARLEEARRLMEPVDARTAAAMLDRMCAEIGEVRAALEAGMTPSGAGSSSHALRPTPTHVLRAAQWTAELSAQLHRWFTYYDGYDPLFSWWARTPFAALKNALDEYQQLLRERLPDCGKNGTHAPIIGDPIGRNGLLEELRSEFISYDPEELLAIAEREFAWSDREWLRAAQEMGFGNDWKAALNHIKDSHVEPGHQPAMISEMALEAINFLRERDLVTIPDMAAELWRMRMMTAEEQKVNPFFLGGEEIWISYPTDAMTHTEKLQSLRANNRYFARATVHHELVPGHHLQYYWQQRINQHRQLFETPFWVEGWALWWEFYLWELGFAKTPEERGGMLFWRAHRCARIIFSLNFHLGHWTPQQCIDFLVDRVGHDIATATGEVRRSLLGTYPPLYQAAYMLGALQMRKLHEEMVASGRMSDKAFHDCVVTAGPIPLEMVRALLNETLLPENFEASWRW